MRRLMLLRHAKTENDAPSGRDQDRRLRGEIEQGMREADDPTVERIPNRRIEENWRRRRAVLVKLGGKESR